MKQHFKMKLTINEQKVLDYLLAHTRIESRPNRVYYSPTEIGRIVGGHTDSGRIRHSSWACPILKSLVSKGLVVKGMSMQGTKGHYAAKKVNIEKLIDELKDEG